MWYIRLERKTEGDATCLFHPRNMFAAIYHWKLKEGVKEAEFVEHWGRLSREIKETYGSLGATLHRTESGEYVSYARWPSKDKWQSMMDVTNPNNDGGQNKELVEYVRESILMEVIDDILD